MTRDLKRAATAAFRDNSKREKLSPEERETAARFYEGVASGMVDTASDLACLYNLERAKFLRGQVDHIAPTAGQFGDEIGYEPPAGS